MMMMMMMMMMMHDQLASLEIHAAADALFLCGS